ncbi:MAG: dienelactone hydrolase family protein [Rhodospirillales bacterium]|nr:dienelactone hydrolase family protein [Rhodospirillales bacterium]
MRVLAFVLMTIFGAGCATYESGAITSSLAEQPSGRIWFVSKDPYDFAAVADSSAKAIIIHGDLIEPEGDWNGGAVILSHGSGGTSRHHFDYADDLARRGYSVMVLDHFTPRRVLSTAHEQVRVTEQMMVADVYAALHLLATHPKIAPDRIGVVGWSKGGIVAVLSAVERIARTMNGDGPRLAFAAAFYPYCGFEFPGDRLANPLLMLLGELDDWTPSPPCLALADELKSRAQPVETVVFPSARHGFDGQGPARSDSGWITIRDTSPKCTLVVGQDGVTRSKDGAHDVSTYDNRLEFLKACAVRGASIAGDPEARTRSRDILFDFIRRSTS